MASPGERFHSTIPAPNCHGPWTNPNPGEPAMSRGLPSLKSARLVEIPGALPPEPETCARFIAWAA